MTATTTTAQASGSALFIPLRKQYFDAFANREKHWEYRRLGGRYNARTCRIGRRVVLSLGYGKAHRLTGTITDFMVDPNPDSLPGWLACYGSEAGGAACIRIEVDPSPNTDLPTATSTGCQPEQAISCAAREGLASRGHHEKASAAPTGETGIINAPAGSPDPVGIQSPNTQPSGGGTDQ